MEKRDRAWKKYLESYWRCWRIPWTRHYEKNRQAFTKTDPSQSTLPQCLFYTGFVDFQSLEWPTPFTSLCILPVIRVVEPLYTAFVYFQKAFDCVDRDVIWRLMLLCHYYNSATIRRCHMSSHPWWEPDRTLFCENRCLSQLLNLSKKFADGGRLGYAAVQGRQEDQYPFDLYKASGDMGFADTISPLFHKQRDTHEKLDLCCVAEEVEKSGPKINIGKTEVMRINIRQQDHVQLHQQGIKEVHTFLYLGNI